MGIDSNSYNYRDFQQIWDPTGVNSLLGRTREACLRCRSKRSKCNGEEPCERCERAHEQCVYKRIRTSPHETKQLKESEPSKPAMTDTAGDYPSPPSSEDDGESKNAEDREHELGNDQAESQVVLFGGSQAKTPIFTNSWPTSPVTPAASTAGQRRRRGPSELTR
ncbi:hypothetical protein BC936DRAFT_138702 [Jimgerdemannia flammicorona]|uniref:Zn(2)-C6 fungal-type domain-containing protein n=1 Tax=Jimgerdemannia flammicorona TaxID=994334 RepID=A0A433BRR0_9FUNG|nr:hypothetical protein BC936DRAFT_138702 [Jimgerdemannia flammicorona]